MFGSLWPKSGNTPQRPRHAERFAVSGLSCALGDVLDISASGLRVRTNGKLPLAKGQVVTLTVCNENQCCRVAARVVWTRRGGIGRPPEIGFAYVDARPGIAAALVQLGRFGFISTHAGDVAAAAEPAPSPAQAAGPEPAAAPAGASPIRAAIEVEDLYALLGVTRDATLTQIRAAFHAKAQEWHPDRNPSAEAAARFSDLSKAWKVLKNDELRRRYDQILARCQAA